MMAANEVLREEDDVITEQYQSVRHLDEVFRNIDRAFTEEEDAKPGGEQPAPGRGGQTVAAQWVSVLCTLALR